MPIVHVLCAPPNGRNPGMASVDLAFGSVAKAVGNPQVHYWRLWDPSEWLEPVEGSEVTSMGTFRDPDTELTYRPLRGHLDEFLSADAVIYWGDFHHMAVYQRHTVDVLTRRMGLDLNGFGADFVARHLLLRGQSRQTLDRVLTFGTTLMFNESADYRGEYGSDLAAFLTRARRAWFRDPYSAHVAQLNRPAPSDNCKGVDAAMLLPSEHTLSPRDALAVFLGRSRLVPEWVAAFGRGLAQALRLAPEWIPWGAEPAFWPMAERKRLRLAWPGLEHQARSVSPAKLRDTVTAVARNQPIGHLVRPTNNLFAQISSSALVLTDTYHLAVNAWRLGTPAVCLFDGLARDWNVNSGTGGAVRDKRADLYSQLDAIPLLVDMTGEPKKQASRIARLIGQDLVAPLAVERVAQGAERARNDLAAALSTILGSPPTQPQEE